LINDVPERPRDRRPHGPRTTAAFGAALAAALVAAALAGCGGGGSESSTSGSSSTSASVSTASTAATHATSTTKTTTGPASGSNTGQSGQQLTVPQVVNALLTSSDPAKVCSTGYVTQHYLAAAYGGKQGCVQAQNPKNAATSVDVGPVTQASNQPRVATAKAIPTGGLYDGEKLTASLVQEDGSWKLDALKSNAPVGP
jgi:hypothetical protein